MSNPDQSKKVTCVDKDGNQFEVPASELTLRASIYGVIIKDEKILLVHQWDGYDFPGGGIDLGESLRDALVREVREETGLVVTCGEVVASESSFYRTEKGTNLHSILLYFTADVVGGELSLDGLTEVEKGWTHDLPEWIPVTDIEKIKFCNSVDSRKVIEAALKKRSLFDLLTYQNTAMPKILLLDADGVTIVPRTKYFSDRYAEEFGVPKELIMPFFRNEFGDCVRGTRELREVIAEQDLLKKWQWAGTLDELLQYWWAGENTRYEAVLEVVRILRERGVRCYLATDQERNRAEYIVHGMGLGQELNGTFFSYQLGFRKTDAAYWAKVLAALGNPDPATVQFWDDEEENIVAAKAASIDARFFTGVEDFKKALSI